MGVKQLRRAEGFTLIAALLLLLLMSGLAVGLMYMTNTEVSVGGNDRENELAYYGAEAGMEKMTSDLGNLYTANQAPSFTSITALQGGNGFLEAVRWRQGERGEVQRPIRHLFLFIGADPNSAWLTETGVTLDSKGFVLTGGELGRQALETSRAGIFAVGDIRSGSVKRVATAVGDGAQVVASLHQYLAAADDHRVQPPGARSMVV